MKISRLTGARPFQNATRFEKLTPPWRPRRHLLRKTDGVARPAFGWVGLRNRNPRKKKKKHPEWVMKISRITGARPFRPKGAK